MMSEERGCRRDESLRSIPMMIGELHSRMGLIDRGGG